jgi:hypothetical protein
MTEFLVTQIGEITELDNFAAGLAELVEGFADERHFFGGHDELVGAGQFGGRIEREAGFVILGLQGNGRVAAAALGGVAALAKIARFICGDAEEPGLKLALAVKRLEVADDGEKNFLANFLGVFVREIGAELEDETTGGGVVQIEELVPGIGLPATASFQQFGFGAHAIQTVRERLGFEQNKLTAKNAESAKKLRVAARWRSRDFGNALPDGFNPHRKQCGRC